MKLRDLVFIILLVALSVAGCHGQAPVTPAPTASISNTPAVCPSGYTCGYIVSRASCTSSTTCPTPGNPGPGPYTALQTPTTALSSPNFTDPSPPTGVFVVYSEQVVFTNLSPPWTGPPSPASTPQSIPLYPSTLGAPGVTITAALAPTLLPDAPLPQLVANSSVPMMGRPKVRINFR